MVETQVHGTWPLAAELDHGSNQVWIGIFCQEDPLCAALPERPLQLLDANHLLLCFQLQKRRRYLWGCFIQNVHTRVYYTQLSGKVNKFYREFSRFCQISFPVPREFIPK